MGWAFYKAVKNLSWLDPPFTAASSGGGTEVATPSAPRVPTATQEGRIRGTSCWGGRVERARRSNEVLQSSRNQVELYPPC